MSSAERPRGFRFVLTVLAVLFTVLLVLIAGWYFLSGLEHPDYDSHENRSPELIIAVSAASLLCGLAALRIAVNRLRGRGAKLRVMLAWEMLTALLILATAVIALASGPL